jgi:hypothetical protein
MDRPAEASLLSKSQSTRKTLRQATNFSAGQVTNCLHVEYR